MHRPPPQSPPIYRSYVRRSHVRRSSTPRRRRSTATSSAASPPASLQAALRLLALLVTLAALVAALAGCRAAEDETPEPAEPAAGATAEPVEVRASVPIEGYEEVDPAWLEAERLDDSWRSGAERDRLARAEGGADRALDATGDPGASRAGGVEPAGERAGAAGTPARKPAAGAAPSSPGSESDDTASGSAAGRPPGAEPDAAPVERMRRSAAPAAAGSAARTGSGRSSQAAAPSEGAASGAAESWDDLSPDAFADFEPRFPIARDGGGPTVLALQRLLDRARFSPGVVDGRWGKNTEKALYWLQDALGLEPTGTPDRALWDRLAAEVGEGSPLVRHRVTAADLEGPFVEVPEEVGEQAELECLCHGSPAEALAERFHTTRELLAKLNPETDLDALTAGTELWVPDVETFDKRSASDGRVARIVIAKDGFYLHALDDRGRVLYHFPTTVGAGYDPSPSGDYRVTATAWDPTFHYQPKLFADVSDTEEEHLLPAGPNSPVGAVWMQLSKDNYGIHGTSAPETIGYTTSHGCVRLTNWDVTFLAGRTAKGTPVEFRGGDGDGSAAESPAAAE